MLYLSCCLWNIHQHLWSLAVCSWGTINLLVMQSNHYEYIVYVNGSVTFSPYATRTFYISKTNNLCSSVLVHSTQYKDDFGFKPREIRRISVLLTLTSPTEPEVGSINSSRMTLPHLHPLWQRPLQCLCLCACAPMCQWQHSSHVRTEGEQTQSSGWRTLSLTDKYTTMTLIS